MMDRFILACIILFGIIFAAAVICLFIALAHALA